MSLQLSPFAAAALNTFQNELVHLAEQKLVGSLTTDEHMAAIGAEIGRTLLSNALYSAVYDQKDLVKSHTGQLSLRTVDQLQIEKRAWTSGKIDSILPVAATQLEHVLSRAKAVKRLNQQKGFENVSEQRVKR